SLSSLVLPFLVVTLTAACQNDEPANPDAVTPHKPLVIYSGRSESLVGPLFARLEKSLGFEIQIKYGSSAGLAATLMEEQAAGGVEADLFFSQDAGALGLLSKDGLLTPLPPGVLERVP